VSFLPYVIQVRTRSGERPHVWNELKQWRRKRITGMTSRLFSFPSLRPPTLSQSSSENSESVKLIECIQCPSEDFSNSFELTLTWPHHLDSAAGIDYVAIHPHLRRQTSLLTTGSQGQGPTFCFLFSINLDSRSHFLAFYIIYKVGPSWGPLWASRAFVPTIRTGKILRSTIVIPFRIWSAF